MTSHERSVETVLEPIKGIFFPDGFVPKYIRDSVDEDIMKGISLKMIELDLVLHLSSKVKAEKKNQYVYLIKTDHGVKIGKSRTPEKRIHNISTKIPFKIIESEYFKVDNMSKTEASMHSKYKENRLNGEWFDLTDKQYKEIKDTLQPLFKVNKVEMAKKQAEKDKDR